MVRLSKELLKSSLNAPVVRPQSLDDWRERALRLGKYCCGRNLDLVPAMVDYYIAINSTDIINCDWVSECLEDFDRIEIKDYLKREIIVLIQMLPTVEVHNLICRQFPLREQSYWNTLWMLRYCSDQVSNAMDDEDGAGDLVDRTRAIFRCLGSSLISDMGSSLISDRGKGFARAKPP